MHGSLLVTHQDMLDAFLFVQRIVDVEYGSAGVTPDVFDLLGLHGANQNFSAVELFGMGGMGLRSSSRLHFRLGNFHDEP